MHNQITTIFFDLFGVLLGINQSVVVQYLSRLIEVPYLETREVAMGESFMRLERNEINFRQYVDEIRAALPNGKRIESDALKNIWVNSKVGEMPSVSLLEKFQSNYQIWIISNTTESHIEALSNKFSFFSLVNGVITSERAGAHKPSLNFFQFALSETDSESLSSIFIDDSRANVKSAENMGIISHHYTSFDGFMKFINKLDFRIGCIT